MFSRNITNWFTATGNIRLNPGLDFYSYRVHKNMLLFYATVYIHTRNGRTPTYCSTRDFQSSNNTGKFRPRCRTPFDSYNTIRADIK